MYFGGQPANAHIEVVLVSIGGFPIANFPAEDMWVNPESSTYLVCPGSSGWGFNADVNSDVDGETYFENPFNGGGWTEDPIWFYLNGMQATNPDGVGFPPIPLRFNSADISGDGTINLVDISLFSVNYFGEYHYRSDFHWDGVLNLSDVALMSSGVGLTCD